MHNWYEHTYVYDHIKKRYVFEISICNSDKANMLPLIYSWTK